MDVAVFCDVSRRQQLADAKRCLEEACQDERVTLSMYSTRTAERMSKDGSLFLWHLKLEGTVLWEREGWWTDLASRIVAYSPAKATTDVETFLTVLRDCEQALNLGGSTVLFEAATVFAALRGIGMIRAMLAGRPCFSRGAAREALAALRAGDLDLGLHADDLDLLEHAKLVYSRKCDGQVPGLDAAWCAKTAAAARKVAEHAREALVTVH